jgi:hypothetical protein
MSDCQSRPEAVGGAILLVALLGEEFIGIKPYPIGVATCFSRLKI